MGVKRRFSHREECSLRVFENSMLREKFGSKRNDVTGEKSRLQNEELYVLYSSPSVMGVMKSRLMVWLKHVSRMGKRRGADRDFVGRPEGETVWKAWTGLIWLRIATGCVVL
jgi:hypothetical protein